MSAPPLSAEDFTVGWITAVNIENTAARMLRDEKLEPDIYIKGDDNIYSYGRIEKHLVVIACLPAGKYGIASAADVARDMLRSFPNLRFGLMVGIGGGAPLRYDIRLGDVVVSEPDGQTGGVIQYQFGKLNQATGFERKGALNKPPGLLLSAINGLKSEHAEDGLQHMENSVGKLSNARRLGETFSRPPPETDNLYVPSFTHPDKDEQCEPQCASQPDKIQRRNPRSAKLDFTVVHYGIIASGDWVMKDAKYRDMIAAKENIKCFEMEAAGLMDTFPCIVIRGICDYSDSHKNDKWQGYAAAVAAAYAKDLLRKIPAQVVQRLETAAKVVQHNVTFYDQSTSNRIEHQQNNPQYNMRYGGTNFINHGDVGNQVDKQTINGNLTFNQ